LVLKVGLVKPRSQLLEEQLQPLVAIVTMLLQVQVNHHLLLLAADQLNYLSLQVVQELDLTYLAVAVQAV
jgi:hypothetical protein